MAGYDYNDVPIIATGDWIDASWINTNIGDNLRALWVGTSAGDMDYYLDHNTKDRLALGSQWQVLSVNLGKPAWVNLTAFHQKNVISNVGTTQSTNSGSMVDVTGASVNLITARPCTIFAVGNVVGYVGSGGGSYSAAFDLLIDGTAVGNFLTYAPYPSPICIAGYKGAVAAGTRTVKLRFSSPFGVTVHSYGGYINVFALPE